MEAWNHPAPGRARLWKLAPAAVLTAVFAAPLTVSAASEEGVELVEEIVVTGSRLRGAVAPIGSPIISLDRDDIEASPATSVDELLHALPQVFDLGVSETSRGQSGGNGNIVWANSVNLRGIGPYATLVLIDGHRVNSNARTIDPSILPSLALERIEVVADGASAIYGSDAIAGVVNMIMRREVDGFDFIARRGFGDEYDEHRIGASWGNTWSTGGGDGSFFLAVENAKRSNLSGRDRDYFRSLQPEADYRVDACNPGTLMVDGTSYAIPQGGVTAASAGSLTAGTENLCEDHLNQDILPEQEYDNVAFTFTQDINDRFGVYLDGFYSDRAFVRQPAHDIGGLNVPSSNAFFVVPPGVTADSVTVQYAFEGDLPANEQTGYQRNWELTGGFKAALAADWRLEGLVTYGDLREVSESVRGLDSRDLAAALASSDPATAFDPFGGHRTSDAVLAAISDQIFIADTSNELLAYELRADGTVFEIPGGQVQLAVGYERQEHTNEPGLQRGSPGAPNNVRHFERDVNSYYAEVLVPVVGEANAMSGIRRLDINAAIRHDDYSDVGSTTNPKLGISYAPIDALTLRASYGTSFRAPLFSQLFGNSSALFVQGYSDPTAGGAVLSGVALSGGNLALEPEEATTWSLGLDYRPESVPGLALEVTFFDVDYEGQIETYLADLSILSREQEFAGTGIILRDAAAEAMVQSLLAQGFNVARGVLPTPVTLFVDGRTNNLGQSNTEGFDFTAGYQWSTGVGEMSARLGGMYLTSFESSITPTAPLEDHLNEIFNPLEFKVSGSLGWARDRYAASLLVRHTGGYDNTRVVPRENVSSFTTVDVSASVVVGSLEGDGWLDGIEVKLDIQNLFDEDPPYVNIAPGGNGGGGFDPSAANPVGRLFGVSVSKRL